MSVSNLTQEALRSALAADRVDHWLDEVGSMRPLGIEHSAIASAVTASKDEFEGHA